MTGLGLWLSGPVGWLADKLADLALWLAGVEYEEDE